MAEPRHLILLTCYVGAFFATGPIFGWPALQLMLYDEGIYADECADTSSGPSCPERKVKMNTIFATGFFTCFAGRLMWGMCLDAVGPRFTSTVACLTVAVGAVLMAVGNNDLDVFPVASALIGLGGPGVHCANFHVSNLFPQVKRTVTTGFSGVFGYAGVLVIVAVALCIVQNPRTFKPGEKVEYVLSCRRLAPEQPQASSDSSSAGAEAQAKPESYWMTVFRQTASGKGIGITLFFSLHFLHLQFYLGNAKDMLAILGDDGTFAIIFNVIGSSAVAWAICVGTFLDRVNFDVAFAVCIVFGVAFNICYQIETLEFQVLTFIFWTMNRLILFAGYFSFLPATFGFKTFGTITGITSCISAGVGLVSKPLSTAATLNDAYDEIMWGFLPLLMLSVLFPIMLRRWRLQEIALASKAHSSTAQESDGVAQNAVEETTI